MSKNLIIISFISLILFFLFLNSFIKKQKSINTCPRLGKVIEIYLNNPGEEDFVAKMKFLKKEGFNPILINELYNYKLKRSILPKNPVIISINDGDKSWGNVIFPSLKKLNLKANFFITTDFAGGLLTWGKIKEIKNFKNLNGENLFEIGSHSVNHDYNLFHENNSNINRENEFNLRSNFLYQLFYSKKIIEENTKSEISYFSIPYAGFNDYSKEAIILRGIAKDVGYKGILSSDSFVIPDKYFIKTELINIGLSFKEFKKRVMRNKDKICQ